MFDATITVLTVLGKQIAPGASKRLSKPAVGGTEALTLAA